MRLTAPVPAFVSSRAADRLRSKHTPLLVISIAFRHWPRLHPSPVPTLRPALGLKGHCCGQMSAQRRLQCRQGRDPLPRPARSSHLTARSRGAWEAEGRKTVFCPQTARPVSSGVGTRRHRVISTQRAIETYNRATVSRRIVQRFFAAAHATGIT